MIRVSCPETLVIGATANGRSAKRFQIRTQRLIMQQVKSVEWISNVNRGKSIQQNIRIIPKGLESNDSIQYPLVYDCPKKKEKERKGISSEDCLF
jgi:hypothetical protein